MTTTPVQEQAFDRDSFSGEMAVIQSAYLLFERLLPAARGRVMEYLASRFEDEQTDA